MWLKTPERLHNGPRDIILSGQILDVLDFWLLVPWDVKLHLKNIYIFIAF